jgi:hypothetical protein
LVDYITAADLGPFFRIHINHFFFLGTMQKENTHNIPSKWFLFSVHIRQWTYKFFWKCKLHQYNVDCTGWTVLTVSPFQIEMRDKVIRLVSHACSLKKCFSRKNLIINFSKSAMNAITRVLILKLHKKHWLIRMLKHLNWNHRFIKS